jgi:hypothetical protein
MLRNGLFTSAVFSYLPGALVPYERLPVAVFATFVPNIS